jgi:PGF-CTERM protein
MNRVVRLVVAAVVILALSAAPAAATQSQTTLTVSVVDGDDTAVGDATVTATWDGGERTATTASNGRAFVDVPEGADVTLEVDHENYTRNFPVVVEDATERDVTIRVSLKGEATVSVTDGEDEPLANATVQFRQNGRTVVEGDTDAEGRFESGTIERGTYTVRAVKPGYVRESITARVRAHSSHDLSLERGSVRLEVTAVDDHFDPPERLENAVVRVDDADGEVARVRASGGTASLSVPVNTRYTVTVTKEEYLESSRSLTVRESDRSLEVATQRVPSLTVEPLSDRVVVGETTRLRVVNAYGEPVANVTVRKNGEAVGETDAAGELLATVDTAGENEFRAVGDDLESDPVVVEGIVPSDEETATATATETATETATDGTDGDGAGFGALAALAALAAALVVARRR